LKSGREVNCDTEVLVGGRKNEPGERQLEAFALGKFLKKRRQRKSAGSRKEKEIF